MQRPPRTGLGLLMWGLTLLVITTFLAPMAQCLGNQQGDLLARRHTQMGLTSTATINPVLTSVARKFMQDMGTFVGARLAPYFYTNEKSSDYYVTTAEDEVSVPTLKAMAPGQAYGRSLMHLSDDTYNCKKYGHEVPVPVEDKKRYASAFDASRAALLRNLRIIRINHEKRVKAAATAGTVPNSSPTNKWDNYTTSTPHLDVDVAKEAIYDAVGMDPNLMIIPRQVWRKLKYHTKLLELFGSANKQVLTLDMLKQVFEIDDIIIAGGLINSAADGQALAVEKIWSDSVILAHANASQDLQAMNFLRTFVWTAVDGGGEGGTSVLTYSENNTNTEVNQIRHYTDEKLVGSAAGYHLSDVLS